MAVKSTKESHDRSCDEDEYLPEKPQEPLPTDCCGSGCTPCVMDLYQEELTRWLELKAMTSEERQQWWIRKYEAHTCSDVALSAEEFRQFQLISVVQVSKNSFLYSFKLPKKQVLGLAVGQHAIMRLKNNEGHYITRQYTPVSSLSQTDHFDVLIKIYENGIMSQLIKSLQITNFVDWKGPFGDFVYTPNQFQQLVLLACGTGITPMIQVINYILDNENDDTNIKLLYSCQTQHDILLKDRLNEFSAYWNFQVIYFLSRSNEESVAADKGSICYQDQLKFVRIDQSILMSEIIEANVKVLICGTWSFTKDMIKYLFQLGYTSDQIFKF